MEKMLADLNREFKITQSEATYYIGLQIERSRPKKEIRIHQTGIHRSTPDMEWDV